MMMNHDDDADDVIDDAGDDAEDGHDAPAGDDHDVMMMLIVMVMLMLMVMTIIMLMVRFEFTDLSMLPVRGTHHHLCKLCIQKCGYTWTQFWDRYPGPNLMNTEHDGTVRHGLCSKESGPKYGPEMGPPDGPKAWQFADAWKSKTEVDTSVSIISV